jgi:hypothetical protein
MDLRDGQNVTTACNEAVETEPDPQMMQSIEEHQEIPKEEAAVMLVREPRKQSRVCKSGYGAPPEEDGKDQGKL